MVNSRGQGDKGAVEEKGQQVLYTGNSSVPSFQPIENGNKMESSKAPRKAAVTITTATGSNTKYADMMKEG